MVQSLLIVAFIGVVVAICGTGYLHGILLDIQWQPAVFEGIDGITTNHLGHYKNVVQAISNLTAVAVHDQLLSSSDSDIASTFGIFFDDPAINPDSSIWRSKAGLVLSQQQLASVVGEAKYKKIHIDSQKCWTAEFPLVSSLSIFIGMFKSYPVLTSYKHQNNIDHGAIIELYDFKNKKIHYIALEKTSVDNNFL